MGGARGTCGRVGDHDGGSGGAGEPPQLNLGSTNGTFLGEERIRDERRIENQAEFRVGSTRFMLIVSDRD